MFLSIEREPPLTISFLCWSPFTVGGVMWVGESSSLVFFTYSPSALTRNKEGHVAEQACENQGIRKYDKHWSVICSR